MHQIRIIFLLLVALGASGYRFRCWAFCTDQTAIQHDYVEQRDRCRQYAELKQDMALRGVQGPVTGKDRKTSLVTLFNECMGNNGWNIAPVASANAPAAGPGPASTTSPVAAAAVPVKPVADAAVTKSKEKAALTRASECMFARHAARNSSIAATRAKACDLECAQRLKAAPDAPRPAACPSDVNPDSELTRGGDKGL
jgi:hypothetical protein